MNPEFCRHYRDRRLTPDNGGFPTDRYALSFICPSCGPPHRVMIDIGPERLESPRTWQASHLPMSAQVYMLPSPNNWLDRVTITPSIDNTKAGHGRKHPTCSFHAYVVNGEVVMTP